MIVGSPKTGYPRLCKLNASSVLMITLMFQGLFKKMLEMDECELIIKFHDKNQADLMPHMLILAKNCFCPKNFPMSKKFWESVPKLVIPKI